MNLEKIMKVLDEHNLSSGIKKGLIKKEEDYFSQAVIIVAGLRNELREEIIEVLDDVFVAEGYKIGDFIRAVTKYEQELEDLYKVIMGKEA